MISNAKRSVEVTLYSPLDNNKFMKATITPIMYFQDDTYQEPISHSFEYLFKFGINEVEKSTPDEIIEKTIYSLKTYVRSPHLYKYAIEKVIDFSLDPFFKEYLKLKYGI